MCTWIYRTCCSRVQVVERQLEILEFRSLSWKPVHFKSIVLVRRKFSVLYFTVLFAWDVCDQTASWWFWQYTGDVGASFVCISGPESTRSTCWSDALLRWCRVWQWCQPWWARWLFCWPSLQPSLYTNCPRMLIFFDSCVSFDPLDYHHTHHCYH